MTEKHLGESVAAVADGHLTGAARERALAHIAVCAGCRREVELHRSMRTRLAALDIPLPPTDLTARLLALAPHGHRLPVAAHRVTFGGPTRPAVLERPAAHAFSGRSKATRARVGRRRMVAAGMLAAAALGGGATLGVRSGGIGGNGGPVVTPGDIELSRYTQMSRSVVMDDPAPELAAAHH